MRGWAGLNRLRRQARSMSSYLSFCWGGGGLFPGDSRLRPPSLKVPGCCISGLSFPDARQEPFIELGDVTFDMSPPPHLPPRAARSGRRLIPRPSENIKRPRRPPRRCLARARAVVFLFFLSSQPGLNSGILF